MKFSVEINTLDHEPTISELSEYNFGLQNNFYNSSTKWEVFAKGKHWEIDLDDFHQISTQNNKIPLFAIVSKDIYKKLNIYLFEKTLIFNKLTNTWNEIKISIDKESVITKNLNWNNQTTSFEDWEKYINKILEKIDSTEIEKIVAARTINFNTSNTKKQILEKLFLHRTSNSLFFLDNFFGLTPEMVFSSTQNQIHLTPMAGTIYSGNTQEETKLSQEHNIVIDELVENLKKTCSNIDILNTELKSFDNISHLVTPIEAELNEDKTILELLDTIHPNSTISGFPSQKSLEIIKTYEPINRGLYSSSIGWFNNLGESLFALSIRCSYINPDSKEITFYSGAGIVKGSTPKEEWIETDQKLNLLKRLLEI